MAENLWKNYKPDTRPVGNLWTRAVAPSREVVGVEDEDDEGMTLGDQKIEAASSEPLEKPTTTEATQTLPPPDAAVPVDPVQPPSSVGGKESLPVDVLTTKDNSMTTQQSTTPTGTQQPQQPLMATASQTQTTSGVSGLASGEQQKRDELIKKLDTNIDKAFGALPPEAQERISGELLGFREGLKELYADPEREADIKAFKQEMKTLKNDLDEIKEKKVDPSRYMSQPRNVIGMLVGGVLTAM